MLAGIAGACVDAAADSNDEAGSVVGRVGGSGGIEADRDDKDASLENLSHVRRSSCNLHAVTGQSERERYPSKRCETRLVEPASHTLLLRVLRVREEERRHDIPHQLLFQLLYPAEVGHVSRIRLLLFRSRRGSSFFLWTIQQKEVSYVHHSRLAVCDDRNNKDA